MKALLLLLLCGSAFGQAVNPSVTQANIGQTICVSGWTKTIRPPVSYTNRIKYGLMDKAGIPRSRAHELELDHLVALAIGGHPRDPANLVLQPWNGPDGAHAKDAVEVAMQHAVCRHKVTLAAAQACMAHDWHTCSALNRSQPTTH